MADASVTLSVILSEQVQRDGRIWVIEQHTDNIGVLHQVIYLASVNDNLATALATHATNLAASLKAGEIAVNVAAAEQFGSLAVYSLNYSTQAENDLALRQVFLTATGLIAVNLGDFLRTIGTARLTVAFSLGSVIALLAVLNSFGTTATTVRAAAGQ